MDEKYGITKGQVADALDTLLIGMETLTEKNSWTPEAIEVIQVVDRLATAHSLVVEALLSRKELGDRDAEISDLRASVAGLEQQVDDLQSEVFDYKMSSGY
jgi:uncharacterized protein YlxW (UPF0749 family)